MGLEYRPDLPEAHVHGRGEGSGEFCGVVGEVVRYSDAVKAPQYLEAAVYPR